MGSSNLRLPGPVQPTRDIQEAASRDLINHRGPEYADMLARMTENLQTTLATRNDVYFITASGTGAMEAAIVNTLSPGDTVLALIIGWFGQRFADIADAYGMNTVRLEFAQGDAVQAEQVAVQLKENPDVKAVIVTHNESSTGVSNPLQQICEIVRSISEDVLIIVDAVSSAGGTPLLTDAWSVDVVATASQKAWGCPPGIAMLAFSDRAWQAYKRSSSPRYYFDIAQYRDYLEKGQPPFTPSLPTMFALEAALKKITAEGMENVLARHHSTAEYVRKNLEKNGLSILPERRFASDTVTAVRLPQGVDGAAFLKHTQDEYDVIFGGGQQNLSGKIFRIGHMGWPEKDELEAALEAAFRTIEALQMQS